MKETKKNAGKKQVRIFEFNSLNEFYSYICDTPINDTFRWEKHASVDGTQRFTGTENFNEAVELFKNGWKEGSQKLTKRLETKMKSMEPTMKAKTQRSVAGYQVLVPSYLSGDPMSMLSKKMVPVKQKVVTLNKSIAYNYRVPKEEIEEESIKAFQLIKKVEAQGMRVNLNIIQGFDVNEMRIILKIRLKNSTEKLNLSKLAFPLVHPSMLRRLSLRFLEVVPNASRQYVFGYGRPVYIDEMKKYVGDNEYVLPERIEDVSKIKSLEDL